MPEKLDKMPTRKILNNSYNQGGNDQVFTSSIKIDPAVSDRYDESTTEDPALLIERKETQEEIFQIFISSPYAKKYPIENLKKIEKNDITKVFYYVKEELDKIRKLSAYELVLAINEFFDFNYNVIWHDVLSVELKGEILEDLYENHGMKSKMQVSKKLF